MVNNESNSERLSRVKRAKDSGTWYSEKKPTVKKESGKGKSGKGKSGKGKAGEKHSASFWRKKYFASKKRK